MQRNPRSQSGLFNPRVVVAFSLCSVGVFLAMFSFAATPVSGISGSRTNSSLISPSANGSGSPASKYYFHGTATDDANRAAGMPSATFDTNAPTGSSDASQTGVVTANPEQAANPASVYWLSTAYTGPINGTISLDWYWSSANADAIAMGNSITVTIYADAEPASNTGTKIGQGTAQIQLGATPVLNHTKIPNVLGVVNTNLLIQVTTSFIDTGHDNTVHYGSISAPSSFTLPAPSANGWSIVDSPNRSNNTGGEGVFGVACTSASDCWAVGSYDNGRYQTVIDHWDGNSWSLVDSPNTSSTQYNFLTSVACASESECWAVGAYYNGPNQQTLILRWDGNSWTIINSPNPDPKASNLQGVTCTSVSDCWAVGSYSNGGSTTNYLTLIEHWDGNAWTIVSSPSGTSTGGNTLESVTCTSTSECWAVGAYANGAVQQTLTDQTLIEKWDGNAWIIVSSPNVITSNPVNPMQSNFLSDVTCASSSECWAVGWYDGAQPLIEKWDGGSWTIVNSPALGRIGSNTLSGVTCASASDCWAVGQYYNGSNYHTLIEKWDGNSWTIATSSNPDSTQAAFLSGVTCTSASDCWTVGEGYYYPGSYLQTVIERYTVPAVQLSSVVSRKVHGSAGTFDVDLPLAGPRGVECRSGGASGDYMLVFTFSNPLTGVGGASVTSGTGSVTTSNTDSNDAHNYVVNLTGVTNVQYITVSLTNVTDSAGNSSSAVSATMGVLLGDVNASGVVTSGDTNLCKARALQPVTSANFRNDINASGSITTGDVNLIKQNALSQLPTPP